MAGFDPQAYIAEKQSGFDPQAYIAQKQAMEDQGAPHAAAVKAADWILMGGLPKLAGAVASPTGAAKAAGSYVGLPPEENDPDVHKYQVAKDAEETEIKTSEKLHPIASKVGSVGGFGMNAAILTPYMAAKTLAGKTAINSALGTAVGLLHANANSPAEAVKQTAPYTAFGAIVPGAAESFAGSSVGASTAAKAGNAFFDVPEKVTQRYLENPESVNSAMDRPDVAQRIADTVGDIRQDTEPLNSGALSTLSTERNPSPGASVEDVVNTLTKIKSPQTKELAARLADEYKQRLADISNPNNAGFLTEAEMHEAKQAMQQAAGNWGQINPEADSAMARREQGLLNRQIKTANPEYDSAMKEVAQNINSKKALASKFGVQPDFTGANDSGATFSDRTMQAINDISKANKVDRARILESIKNQGYGDLAEQIQNTLAKETLNGEGRPNGSRKAVIGAGLGTALGAYINRHADAPGMEYILGGLGAAAGGTADKYGPVIFKKGLDSGMSAQPNITAAPLINLGGQVIDDMSAVRRRLQRK